MEERTKGHRRFFPGSAPHGCAPRSAGQVKYHSRRDRWLDLSLTCTGYSGLQWTSAARCKGRQSLSPAPHGKASKNVDRVAVRQNLPAGLSGCVSCCPAPSPWWGVGLSSQSRKARHSTSPPQPHGRIIHYACSPWSRILVGRRCLKDASR